jgi:hypothetical protein
VRLTRALAIAATSVALLMPVSAVTGTAADAAGKPHRHITAKITKPNTVLQLHVHVRNYPNGHSFLEKRDCAKCDWHVVAHRKTNANGRVTYPLGAPATGRWYYRAGTGATKLFAKSYSPKFYTYRA